MNDELIYLRTSTQEQNPENQLKNCLSISKSKQPIIFEEKQSAWKDKDRPEFNKVIGLVKKSYIKHLIVWDLDRLYRNRKKTIEFFRYCKTYNVKIHSYRQSWLEDINKIPDPWNEIVYDLLINIMGWLAEEESNKKSDRIKASVRHTGNITKSYKGNKWGRKSLSKNVRDKIIELRKQGLSIRDIAKEVTYTDKNNNPKNVSKSIVQKILSEI